MIKDALSEMISMDSSCLLGLTKFDKSKFLYSIAPVRYENMSDGGINIADIESKYSSNNPMRIFGEWSTEAGIFECSGCQVQNDDVIGPYNDFISSNNPDEDWKINTNLILNNVLSNSNTDPKDLTIMSLLKIAPSNLFNIDDCNVTFEFSYEYEYEYEEIVNQNGVDEVVIRTASESESDSETLNKIELNDFFEFVVGDAAAEFSGPPYDRTTARYIARTNARNAAYLEKLNEIKNNATTQLFKHSYKDDDKKFIIDIRFVLFNYKNDADDEVEICGKLLFDVIYTDESNSYTSSLDFNLSDNVESSASPESSVVSLANKLFNDEWHLLSFVIDSNYYENDGDHYEFILSFFDGDEKMYQANESNQSFVEDIDEKIKQYEDEDNLNFCICGNNSKQIKMKNVFVFERFIRPEETKFLKLLLNFENL